MNEILKQKKDYIVSTRIIWTPTSEKPVSVKSKIIGSAQTALGGYLGYKTLSQGLPRLLGIRIEYHTTSRGNAELIKKSGYFLDPRFGGKTGLSARSGLDKYISKSKNYVHITGIHKDSKFSKVANFFFGSIARGFQRYRYNPIGNLLNRTKSFCIPGIDSYFNSNFVADSYSNVAIKTPSKLRVYNNRISAMIAGLKEFGLKGMKENISRVAYGIIILSLGSYVTAKLIKKGIDNFSDKNQ